MWMMPQTVQTLKLEHDSFCWQDRVYEERCFAENSASATLMPAGKTPSSSSISRSPLSTIG